jgi:peptidoglycan/LPS O-acetylase OafA/YrhL
MTCDHDGSSFVKSLLSFRPIVELGVISYSLYLFHWPIFVVLKYLRVDLTAIHGVSALVYTLLTSILSYTFVENPCRRFKWPPLQTLVVLLIIPSLLLLGGAFAISSQVSQRPIINATLPSV